MKNTKRELHVLLALAFVFSVLTPGFTGVKAEALSGGSFRIYASTCPNGTQYGLDQGTYDDVYIRFYTGNDGTGEMLYQSTELQGIEHGGNTGNLTFNWSPPVTIRSMQIVKPTGDDDWGAFKTIVYYTPEGGAEQTIWTSPDDYYDYKDGATYNINTTWFSADHNRTVTFNGSGAAGGTQNMNLVWGTSEVLNSNGFTKTGHYLAGWATTAGGPVTYADGGNFGPMPDSNVTLYAVWAPSSYTLIFDPGYGAAVSPSSKTVTYGSTYGAGSVGWPIPTRTGYTFDGWYTGFNGTGSKISGTDTVTTTTDLTLYAKWAENTYTVTYNGNGHTGGSTPNSNHTYDAIGYPSINGYVKLGHSFLGWSLSQSATAPTYLTGQAISNLTAVPNGIVTFFAVWRVNTYNVTFNANGGTGSMPAQSYVFGTTTALNTVGYGRTGYAFQGWATSQANANAGSVAYENNAVYTMATEGAVLYAVWKANSYTVTFDAKGGSGGWSDSMAYGSAITAPTVTKEGHSFIGWDPYVPASVPAYDVTYEALWAVLSYRITFNANGGEGGTINTLNYGSVLTPPTVTKPGYTFTGWLPEVPATVPAADTEYVAQWVADGSVIVFDANGGTGGGSFILKAGEPMTPPAVSRPGYTFAGWSPVVPSVVPAEDTTYTAQWSINSYTISFDANGGTESTSGYMVYGTPLTAPVVSRAGYTFAGWSPAVPATVPAQNMTYTAQWNVNSYIITFDANGGTGSTSLPMNFGVTLSAPFVTREGYTFAGWSPAVPATVPAQNATYTAQWTINSYLITFDAGGGTGGTSETMDYGEALTAPDVTREGYTFAGWSPAVPATVPAQNATYTAQWTVNSYLITFDANGGAGGTSAAMDYGEPLAPPAVTKDGYTFAGWSPEVPATVPAADTVYTAQWSLNTATVQFDLNGGAGTVPESQTGEPGAAVTLPAQGDIAREYYNFLGWAQQPDATVPLVSFIIPEAGATLYAVWTRIPVELVKADGSTTVINNGEKLIFGLEEGLTKNGFAANFVRVNGDATLRYTYVSDSFGTGTVVELVDNVTGEVVETYTVIIFGDVDGDGFITVADENIIDMVSSYQLELENAAFLFAADLTQDGFVDAFDLNILSAATSYTATIDQTNPSGV